MKMHLRRQQSLGGGALCGQRSKKPLRTTNVSKMEDCKKCIRIRRSIGRKVINGV